MAWIAASSEPPINGIVIGERWSPGKSTPWSSSTKQTPSRPWLGASTTATRKEPSSNLAGGDGAIDPKAVQRPVDSPFGRGRGEPRQRGSVLDSRRGRLARDDRRLGKGGEPAHVVVVGVRDEHVHAFGPRLPDLVLQLLELLLRVGGIAEQRLGARDDQQAIRLPQRALELPDAVAEIDPCTRHRGAARYHGAAGLPTSRAAPAG